MFKKAKSRVTAPAARKLVNLVDCARALKLDHGQLSRESKSPGFPSSKVGRVRMFDVAAVRKWREENIRPRRSNEGAAPSTPISDADPSVVVLRSRESTPVELANAGARLAARRLADGAATGTLGASAANDLRNALENLRRAESAHLTLEERRGQLIGVAEVNGIMGAQAARLIQAFATLESTLATEVAVWMNDPNVQAMPAEERNRMVRAFVAKSAKQIRTGEADDVEKMLAELGKD